MKKYYRKLFFWMLFLFFVVTAPVAVLYSQGYRFDQKRMIFVHSGSITIKSVPSNISIYIDGEKKPANNLDIINSSVTIGGLKPGRYNLRVNAENHSNWEKNIDVHSGLSSEFWNILLVPNEPVLQNIASSNVSRFFPSPFGKRIAYIEESEKNLSVFVVDFKKNEKDLLYSEKNASISKDQLENLEWNFKEDLILVPIIKGEKDKDYLIASASGDFEPYYLSNFSNLSAIQKVRWSPQEKNTIYFLGKENDREISSLFKFNQEENEPQLILPEAISYDLSQNSIYFLEKNNILMKSDLSGNGVRQVNDNQFTDQQDMENARLIVYDETRQALISKNGDLYVHNKTDKNIYQRIAQDVQGVQFSDDGKKLLFWSNNEISVLFLRKWEVQPYRYENEIQTIVRVSSPLKNVFWYQDYEHVFYSVKNKVKITEIDPRDRRVSVDIYENNTDDFPATYDIRNGYYFFLTEIEGIKNIMYFVLPEKTGFFR